MAKVTHFKEYSQGTAELFPPTLDELVPEGSKARMVSDVIDQFNFDGIYDRYHRNGCRAYHPRMMFKVLIFAYMNNAYSCREIEECLRNDVRYMWLSGGQKPDFITINRFRQRVKDSLNEMFTQVVGVLARLGRVSLEKAYVDGTKIESKAGRYTFAWRKTDERNMERLRARIGELLAQVEDVIASDKGQFGAWRREDEQRRPSPVPREAIAGALAAIREEKAAAEPERRRELRERELAVRELGERSEKLRMYEERQRRMGGRNSMSKTDPDATFMRLKEDHMMNGQTKPAYNLQIATENQVITHFGLYPNANDSPTLPHFLSGYREAHGRYPSAVIADAGYGSEENYDFLERAGSEPYVKYGALRTDLSRKGHPNPFHVSHFTRDAGSDTYTCPQGRLLERAGTEVRRTVGGRGHETAVYRCRDCAGCPMRERCCKGARGGRQIEVSHRLERHKEKARGLLTSEEGRRLQRLRCIEPEAVFGQMKQDMRYRRFRHFGKDMVAADFATFAIAFNLKKLLSFLTRKR